MQPNLPVIPNRPPVGDAQEPSPLKVIGGALLKVLAVSAIGLAMIYPALKLADRAMEEMKSDDLAWTVIKFGGLSMGLGIVVSLVCIAIAVRGFINTDHP